MTAFRDSGRDGIAIVAFELLDAGEFREDEIEIALLGLNAPLNYATISFEDFKEPVAANKSTITFIIGNINMASLCPDDKVVSFRTLEMLLTEHPDFNTSKWNRLFDPHQNSNREAVQYAIKSFENCQAAEDVADGIDQMRKYLERK